MPTCELYAAVWKPTPADTKNMSLIAKAEKMANAMIQAHGFMRFASLRAKATNPVYMFTAPEYYWSDGNAANPYDEEAKEAIYSALKDASVELHNLLMFPGTVNWKVPAKKFKGLLSTKGKGRPWVGFNSCPVLLGGELLLDYFKKANDGILDTYSKDKEIAFGAGPGGASQSFSARGLRFGIDICADLNKGQLSLTLGKGRVEVMVLLSGTIGHYFTNSDIAKYPVREGGAFVHCDSSGKDEKNGMWVFNRGKGWHGSSREEVTLVFADRDNRELVIAFPKSVSEVQGNKLSVSAIGGFGPKKELVAIVTKKSEYSILEFTLHLPLSGLRQTAVIRKDTGFGGGYSITLKRRLSRKDTIVKPKKVVETDLHGMTVTGRGNVSKIGKLLPGPVHVDDLNCYAVPITS